MPNIPRAEIVIEASPQRDTCPSCGSGDVTHILFGLPADPGGAPEWVRFGGCVVDGDPEDRICETCGQAWRSTGWADVDEGPIARSAVRLLSPDGAAFALLPVPALAAAGHVLAVDLELLIPDRLVRYLARPLALEFAESLAEFFLKGASDAIPEQTVPTIENEQSGLAVLINQSTPLSVTLEVAILTDLEGDVPEHDGVAFDVPRSALINAAHALKEWSA